MPAPTLREKIETYFIVTVIAVLIWLYAEGANVKQVTRQPIQVRFVAPPGQQDEYAVFPADPIRANVSFQGSSSQIQRFQKLATEPFDVVVDPGDADNTERVVLLENELEQAGFGDLGVSLGEVDPTTHTVTLKRLVTVPMEVRVETGSGRFSDNPPPTPTPDTVYATVPADVADDIRGIKAVARLDRVVPETLTPDIEQVQRDVPLEFPAAVRLDDPRVNVDRRQVQVNYAARKLDDSLTLPRVPLFVNVPVSVQQQYVIRPVPEQNFLTDVELRGPADVIARIRDNDAAYPVRAEIRETDPTQVEFMRSVEPIIIAPPGVTAAEATKLIEVKVERRR